MKTRSRIFLSFEHRACIEKLSTAVHSSQIILFFFLAPEILQRGNFKYLNTHQCVLKQADRMNFTMYIFSSHGAFLRFIYMYYIGSY